jgi:hypothetical protein
MFRSLLIYAADPTPPPTATGGGGFTAPTPAAPPGADKLTTLLAWGLWAATGLLIAAVVIAGVKIAMASHGRGGGGEHGVALLMSLVGAVICGVAASAVSLLS